MPVNEQKILQFWKQNKIYDKVRANRKSAKRFYFLDGPPYATGHIHMGTGLNKILKDLYIRFWRMRGFGTWDQPGYDTHGLPIENKVEALLKIKAKSEIEKLGIDKFNERCRKFATEFIEVMNSEFANLGVWMDWQNPYLTLNNEYIESAWFTFRKAFEKGLLFKDVYVVHVCSHCETAVAYNEVVYNARDDPSIYVKYKMRGKKHEYLVSWTTTPWTVPANTGAMVHPNADYVRIMVGEEVLIMAKDLVEAVMKKTKKPYKIVDEFKGKELEGMKYDSPLADWLPNPEEVDKTGWRVIVNEQFVSLTEGTGIVHTAPGHGQEDFKVAKEQGLPVVCFVGLDGKYTDGKLKGKTAKESDSIIVKELEKRSALLFSEKISHEYPHCWRCETPLLFVAIPQWFFRVTAIREKLLKENEKVVWRPDWAKARFRNWLENLGDWPVGRQRYWGIPLPIWVCEKNEAHITVVGSTKELPEVPKDLHRPHVDNIKLKCKDCKSNMNRVPEVLDVWFDAGLASWASLGWPMKKQPFEGMWPADLNIEGPDQIRGWWNAELITSVILFDRAPFKNIVLHGFILDAKGIKMSKSKGNAVTPEEVVRKHSRDTLRFYLLSSAPWDDFLFNWKDVEDVVRSLTIIENTFNFVKTYVTRVKKADLQPEDLWILSKLNSVIESATKDCENYEAHKALTAVRDFVINDFSRVYIKLVRDRVWPAYGGDDAAFYTLYTVTKYAARMLAPFVPFLAEDVHQNVLRPLGETLESVHMANWPKAQAEFIDKKLEEQMAAALKIIEQANALRNKNGVKLRWPLRTLSVGGGAKVKESVKAFGNVIKQMANIKSVEFSKSESWMYDADGIRLFLDTKMDAELKKEAAVRELIRHIQGQRKQMKLVVEDKIEVGVRGVDVKGFEKSIQLEVGAHKIHEGEIKGEHSKFDLEGRAVEVWIAKK